MEVSAIYPSKEYASILKPMVKQMSLAKSFCEDAAGMSNVTWKPFPSSCASAAQWAYS